MDFEQTTLDNGLTIVAEVNRSAASMAAGFFVRTGSRDETPEVSGVSHFLEHMVFKGTESRSALEVNLDFDKLGANYNAFTSEENTVFYGAVLPEFQDSLLDLLCDILRPALREEDFDLEKHVILDEIALYKDQPKFRVYDRLMNEHFRPHPLANPILGTDESITELKCGQMKSYFAKRYSPSNITLVGVGNLDFDALCRSASRLCSHWDSFETERDLPEATGNSRTEVLHDPKVLREQVAFMSRAPSCQSPDRFAADLIATLIGDSAGSRLYYELVEPAIADEATMSYSPMDAAGGLIIFLSTESSRAPKAMKIVKRVLQDFTEQGPNDQELQAAKNKIASAATLRGEVPMGRLASVGMDWIYRQDYIPLQQHIDMLFAVSRSDITRVARSYDLPATTVVALGPLEHL